MCGLWFLWVYSYTPQTLQPAAQQMEIENMDKVINIRPAKLLLSWQYDPRKAYDQLYNFDDQDDKERWLEEACGIIPDFFERALSVDPFVDIDSIAETMDKLYGFGGFQQYPLDGEVNAQGTYVSEYNDDPHLEPYIAFTSLDPSRTNVEMFVYPYGFVGLRDSHGATKIARFD